MRLRCTQNIKRISSKKDLFARCLFQHLPSSNELGIPFDHTDDGGYLYLGPAEYRIDRELRKPNWNRMTSYIGLQNPGQSICKNEPIYVCAILQKVVVS